MVSSLGEQLKKTILELQKFPIGNYLTLWFNKQHSTPNITGYITFTFGGLSNIWWQPFCADSETPGCAVSDTAKAYWVFTSAPCCLNISWPTWPPVSDSSWPWLSSLLVTVATSALTEVSSPIHYTEFSLFSCFFFSHKCSFICS